MCKTNEHGMKQARVLGLDRYFIYNEKQKNANKFINTLLPELYLKSATTVKPMVRVSDIIKLERNRKSPKEFVIIYKTEGELVVFNYEAKTGREAAEIVARVRYLMVFLLIPNLICHTLETKHERNAEDFDEHMILLNTY